MKTAQTKLRCAAYIRVSRDTGDYKRQISDLKRIADREGYLMEEDDIYAEKITGRSKHNERGAFTRLLTSIQTDKKTYTIVLLTEVSRIARDFNFGYEIHQLFNSLGIAMKFSNIERSSLTPDGKEDKEFSRLFRSHLDEAERELDVIRRRTQSGIQQAARDGAGFAGPNIPYGMKKDENRKLVKDDDELPWLKEIFKWSLEGRGTQAIANILNAKRILTKKRKAMTGRKVHYKDGRPEKDVDDIIWTTATVHGILTNEIYIGKRTRAGELVSSPVLIDEDTFYKVQDSLEIRNNNKTGRTQVYHYILRNNHSKKYNGGLLKCGVCGRNMVAKYRPGKECYYQCASNTLRKSCDNTGVNIVAIESTVWHMFKGSREMLKRVKDTTNYGQIAEDVKIMEDLLSAEERDRTRKENELIGIEKVFTINHHKPGAEQKYISETVRVEKEINQHNNQIEKLKKQIRSKNNQMLDMETVNYKLGLLEKIGKTRQGKAEMLELILDKVAVTAAEKHRNCTKYVLSVFYKELLTPITVVMYIKPKHITTADWTERWADNGMVCYIHIGDDQLAKVIYDDKECLLTPVESVVTWAEEIRNHLAQINGLQDFFYSVTATESAEMTIYKQPTNVEAYPKKYMMQYPLIPMEEELLEASVEPMRKNGRLLHESVQKKLKHK